MKFKPNFYNYPILSIEEFKEELESLENIYKSRKLIRVQRKKSSEHKSRKSIRVQRKKSKKSTRVQRNK